MKNLYNYDHSAYRKRGCRLVFTRIGLAILLCCTAGPLLAGEQAQPPARYDVSYRDRTILSVLSDLKARTGYVFLHMDGIIPADRTVTVEMKDASITQILDRVLTDNGYAYRINNRNVNITRAPAPQSRPSRPLRVTGTVRDAAGQPLPGVSVMLRGTHTGVMTGADGSYALAVPEGGATLRFTFLGKKPVEIGYTGQQTVDVRMQDEAISVDDVVVTGMFNRRAESETGSSVQFKGEQLREAGNQNILRSLANLDPSFMIMESLELGSDPNALPEIRMRGQSSFPGLEGDYAGNPNQPLFILDGFETTLQKIYDLDMNRVATITILKDASAKAIYGSKAGNGVVVIETVRPRTGQITVSYSGTLDIEAPDLTGYNLMHAREKLAFEKLRGMYDGIGEVDGRYGQMEMDALYQDNLRNVMEGVDTYWLSKPLRVGAGQKHSLSLGGGDDRVSYAAGVNYSDVKGVMKGSKRNTFGGNMFLSYRYKNLSLRNSLDFTINNAENSPYGDFSRYARLNPYWRPYDGHGQPVKLLGEYYGVQYYNPLYDATLNTKSTTAYSEIRDNLQLEWTILPNLRLTGRFTFTNHNGKSDEFYPASHTMFIGYSEEQSDRKGRYTKGESESTSYQADVGLSFSKTLGRHMFFVHGNWSMTSVAATTHTYVAEGFGNDGLDDIAFAAQYLRNSTPSGSSDNQREVGVVGALNYSFDDRYLLDGSLRTSGSSMFGADQRWGLFWSLGLGWNIHKEAFARGSEWLDRFKIRGSVGYTGSQNFDPYQAKARYEYARQVYDGGYGAVILGLPNTNLRWQRVLDYNAGVDVSLWKRITLKFDYFITVTDDLLMDVAIPPSTGFPTYKENLGKVENRGFDASLALQLWRNPERRGWLTLTLSGMHNKNEIKKISNTFEYRNQRQNEEKDRRVTNLTDLDAVRKAYTRPSTLYYEGQSMSAIWGVRSAGIDPMTGEELFYDLNGKLVNTWSSLNQAIIGDKSPTLRGNISLNAGYGGFLISVACGYRFGGEVYNTTLVDKLENTDGRLNLDRRILQAWQQPGDESPYRRLDISQLAYNAQPTKATSRFVMRDDELYISTLNVGYDFRDMKGLGRIGIEHLKLSFYMNELVRFSSVEIERGTSYPFARNFSFSLSATF